MYTESRVKSSDIAHIDEENGDGRTKEVFGKCIPEAGQEKKKGLRAQDDFLSHLIDQVSDPRLHKYPDHGNNKKEQGHRGNRLLKHLDENPRTEGDKDLLPGAVEHAQPIVQPVLFPENIPLPNVNRLRRFNEAHENRGYDERNGADCEGRGKTDMREFVQRPQSRGTEYDGHVAHGAQFPQDLPHLLGLGETHADASAQRHENMLAHAIDEDDKDDHRILRRE